MESITAELQSKYQKLAAEYAKIRAQAAVLKKAVVDEQAKTSDLKDLLKEKEQCLRRADQEMESLNFRNQQLTKRITVLQEELDAFQQIKNKKGKRVPTEDVANKDFSQLVDEELLKQMCQNANLVIQLQEKDEEHYRQTQLLMERVQNFEQQIQQLQNASKVTEVEHKDKLNEWHSKKTTLNEKIRERERDCKQYSDQIATLEVQEETLKRELCNKLQTETDAISKQITSIDKEVNVVQHQIISQIGCLMCDFTSQLSDFHTYSEQRLHIRFDPLSPIASKFSTHLKENAKYLRGLEQGYKEFQAGLDSDVTISLKTIPSLSCFTDKLDKYNSYLQKILSYQLLSLNEESLLPSCGEMIKNKNSQLCDESLLFTSTFMKLSNYLQLLAAQTLCTTYADKSKLECDMPSSTEHLKSVNQYLVNSLVSMVRTIKELHAVLSDNNDSILRDRNWNEKNNFSPDLFLEQFSISDAETQPHQSNPHRRSSNREALGEQLQTAQQRLTQLEQDREHWKQEFQLLQMKHIKEERRARDLEKQLQVSQSNATTSQSEEFVGKIEQQSTESSENSPARSSAEEITVSSTVVTALLGQVNCPFATSTEVDAREEEVKCYFTKRINQLVAERQLVDGKAVSLRAECMALHERLQLATAQRSMVEEKLKSAETSLARFQEELHTTTHNYESQLSLMSEHLANMNDKLAKQNDEIDQLKYQLGQKVAKKGKQK